MTDNVHGYTRRGGMYWLQPGFLSMCMIGNLFYLQKCCVEEHLDVGSRPDHGLGYSIHQEKFKPRFKLHYLGEKESLTLRKEFMG